MNNRHLKQVDILRLAAPFCEENDIKLNRNDLSQYVNGKVEPRQSKLYILGQALKVNEAWLMGYDVPMHQKGIVEPNSSSQIKVPVLGTVRAGLPMEAVENILDYEEISEDMARQGDYFALQIKGDSMEPRIKEGDVVIVRKQPDVESGEVAIVLVNGDEATIKKVQKFNGGINLVPSNPAYEVKTYSNDDIESLPVSIIGKVVELRAKF
uniref:S24 family peptidase n=1 Tax=Candidatus Fimenecus sp. TaxID=3022888 RepID=UPI003FEF1277